MYRDYRCEPVHPESFCFFVFWMSYLIALGLSEKEEDISRLLVLKQHEVQDICSSLITEFPHPTVNLEPLDSLNSSSTLAKNMCA